MRASPGPARLVLPPLGLLLGLAFAAATRAEEAKAPPSAAVGASGLDLAGHARLKEVRALGQEVELGYAVANPGPEPVRVHEAWLLTVDRGGWLTPLDPPLLEGTFLRDQVFDGPLAGGQEVLRGPVRISPEPPCSHLLVALRTDRGSGRLAIPVTLKNHAEPPAWVPQVPLDVGVMGPLEAVPFSDGRRSVMVVGQHQVLDGPAPQAVRTRIVLGDQTGTQEDDWKGMGDAADRVALWPFVRRIHVHEGFREGLLRMKVTARLGDTTVEASREWPVRSTEPVRVLGPVRLSWQLGNGPGETRLHAHTRNPAHRYAYDFVVMEDGRTHSGPVTDNASYFAWNRSIHAVADGRVVDVCDHEPDHPGNLGGMVPCPNNRVVIEHAGGFYTAYLHIQHRSARHAVGSDVRAGEDIARVGNSGRSSEPHLHFMAFRIDETGRLVPIPVAFTNARHAPGAEEAVEGVPVGGRTYHFADPAPPRPGR